MSGAGIDRWFNQTKIILPDKSFFKPSSVKAVPKRAQVVVLPTPPFWFVIA